MKNSISNSEEINKNTSYLTPIPKPSVADPELCRPLWTKGTSRDSKILWLDKNENVDPQLAALTHQIVCEVSRESLYSYPECAPLYNRLGKYLGVASDHLLLTAGSDGAIRSVFEAFVSPGEIVVHTLPTFAMYSVYARMYGAKTVPLEYEPSEEGPVLFLDKTLSIIRGSRPRLVCLPNPDSPTGTVFSESDLRTIIEVAGSVGSLILIDEAYYPFYPKTVLPFTNEYPHLIVAQTFSKAWGLAGLRIGYCAACPDLVQFLHKVRPMYEVNTLAVAVVDRMLDFSNEMLKSVQRLNAGKVAFLSAMKFLGFKVLQGHGNFLHVAFGSHASQIHEALKKRVLYRQNFNEPCLRGFSRFSAATVELFQPVIECIRSVIDVTL